MNIFGRRQDNSTHFEFVYYYGCQDDIRKSMEISMAMIGVTVIYSSVSSFSFQLTTLGYTA